MGRPILVRLFFKYIYIFFFCTIIYNYRKWEQITREELFRVKKFASKDDARTWFVNRWTACKVPSHEAKAWVDSYGVKVQQYVPYFTLLLCTLCINFHDDSCVRSHFRDFTVVMEINT